MSNRRWLSFLEHRCLFWQMYAVSLLDDEEDDSSSVSSWSSSLSLSSYSMDSDDSIMSISTCSSDDEVLDEVLFALGTANAIAIEISNTISQSDIVWRRGRSGASIEDLSHDTR